MARVEVAFEIWVKKLRVEDTEPYQEMRRKSYENIPRNFEGYSHITTSHFGLSPFLAELRTEETIIYYHLLVQTTKTIINHHVEFEDHQITW